VAQNVPLDWHSISDLDWLQVWVRDQINRVVPVLPTIGQAVFRPRPISIPTDGVVYDAELGHCCSCEPERQAAIGIRLEMEKATALKACFEAQVVEAEFLRRKMLVQKGDLAPFEQAPVLGEVRAVDAIRRES
jgi:thermitase